MIELDLFLLEEQLEVGILTGVQVSGGEPGGSGGDNSVAILLDDGGLGGLASWGSSWSFLGGAALHLWSLWLEAKLKVLIYF